MDPDISLRKPKVWFAFLVVISICLVNERSSSIVTPKYFEVETLSISTLCRMYLVFKGFALFVIWRTWHLEGLNCIFHIFSHCSRHARSVCRTSLSVVELIERYKAVSSAKSLTLDLTRSGRSLCMQGRELGRELSPAGRQRRLRFYLNLFH